MEYSLSDIARFPPTSFYSRLSNTDSDSRMATADLHHVVF